MDDGVRRYVVAILDEQVRKAADALREFDGEQYHLPDLQADLDLRERARSQAERLIKGSEARDAD